MELDPKKALLDKLTGGDGGLKPLSGFADPTITGREAPPPSEAALRGTGMATMMDKPDAVGQYQGPAVNPGPSVFGQSYAKDVSGNVTRGPMPLQGLDDSNFSKFETAGQSGPDSRGGPPGGLERAVPPVGGPGGMTMPPAAGTPMPTPDGAPASAGPKNYGQAPSGYDQTKWDDPNSDSAKYITARSIDYNALRQIPDEAGRKEFLAKEVQRITPDLEKAGWTVGAVKGDKMQIGGHGYPMNWVDIAGDIEGKATPAWQPEEDGNQGPGGAPSAVGGHSGGGMPTSLDALLSGGGVQGKIQQALAQLSGPRSNAQELLQKLMAGG